MSGGVSLTVRNNEMPTLYKLVEAGDDGDDGASSSDEEYEDHARQRRRGGGRMGTALKFYVPLDDKLQVDSDECVVKLLQLIDHV